MMNNRIQNFGRTAQGLARNPLGIIALFIVLVYGIAALVVAFGGSFTAQERLPLIYFMIIFPVLVLIVFSWMVSRHSNKLFAPGDFKNEDNFVKMQMAAVASLSAASAKRNEETSTQEINRIVEVVQAASPIRSEADGLHQFDVLWVDDRPENNVYERQAFETFGLRFTLALSTDEAFELLSRNNFGAIISDMGRQEGPREGYVLLDRLRQEGDNTPLFFYATSNATEHKLETAEHGGQGCTNNAEELFEMVTNAILNRH